MKILIIVNKFLFVSAIERNWKLSVKREWHTFQLSIPGRTLRPVSRLLQSNNSTAPETHNTQDELTPFPLNMYHKENSLIENGKDGPRYCFTQKVMLSNLFGSK